jgi:hypothetical protein
MIVVPPLGPTLGIDAPARASSARWRRVPALPVALFAGWLALGCSSSTSSPSGGAGGGPGAGGSGATGRGGSFDAGGSAAGVGGSIGSSADAGADAGTCQPAAWQPQTPTVFVLVDQSATLFQCRTSGGALDATGSQCADHSDTSWYPLRDGLLQSIIQLEDDVRFGFAAFTGDAAACPALTPVSPAIDNYGAIAANYNALGPPSSGRNPTRKALDQAGQLLMADAAPGDKLILLVTDSLPDYCAGDSDSCPSDSVVGGLQALYAAKIPTIVFGVGSPLGAAADGSAPLPTLLPDAALQAFANAGAGQPVLAPLAAGTSVAALYDECLQASDWTADLAAAGKALAAGQSIGNYAATGGTATFYKPDPTDQQALLNQISSALSGVRSCIFDISNQVTINLDLLSWAHVLVQGSEVPLNTGWQMNSSSELQLIGDACAAWRKPGSTITFQFPCQLIVPSP